jgi:two-component system response regulator FixJ
MSALHVALVDDDEAVLDALSLYLGVKGLQVSRFGSPSTFLKALDEGQTVDCVVSDVRMPGMDGVALYQELTTRRSRAPVILITGHGEIDLAVTAIKEGVHDFIQKPFDESRLLSSIEEAVATAQRQSQDEQNLTELAIRVARLSDRQKEVMVHAVQGLTNKEIASAMGIGTRTVESYRAWVMERVGAKNLAELIKIAMRLGMTK